MIPSLLLFDIRHNKIEHLHDTPWIISCLWQPSWWSIATMKLTRLRPSKGFRHGEQRDGNPNLVCSVPCVTVVYEPQQAGVGVVIVPDGSFYHMETSYTLWHGCRFHRFKPPVILPFVVSRRRVAMSPLRLLVQLSFYHLL